MQSKLYGDNMEIIQKIGENINLKLRLEKEKLKEELEQVKIQRDIALKRLNKISTTLASVVEYINGSQKK